MPLLPDGQREPRTRRRNAHQFAAFRAANFTRPFAAIPQHPVTALAVFPCGVGGLEGLRPFDSFGAGSERHQHFLRFHFSFRLRAARHLAHRSWASCQPM